jgi:hypothetical protein
MENTEINNTEEHLLDEQYLEELHRYTQNLPQPSPEEITLYQTKIDFINQIYAEIKAKYPSFQPDYDPNADDDPTFPKGKYLESVYSVSPFNNEND